MKISEKQLKKIIREELREDSHKQINEVLPLVPVAAGSTVVLSSAGWAAVAGILSTVLAGAIWWKTKSSREKKRINDAVDAKKAQLAFTIYAALKGWGTNEDAVKTVLSAVWNSDSDLKTDVKKLYDDFDEVLKITDDSTGDDLIAWLEQDGMDVAAGAVSFALRGRLS